MGSDEAVSPFPGRSYGNLIPYERPSPIGSHGAIKFSSFSGGSYGSLIPYEGPSRASWDLTETSLLAHFLGDPMEISHLMRGHFPRISRGHWLIFWKILWKSHTLWGTIFHRVPWDHRIIFWGILWKFHRSIFQRILWDIFCGLFCFFPTCCVVRPPRRRDSDSARLS